MSYIQTSCDGDTAILTFQRPPANAIDLAFTGEFRAALAALAVSPPAGGLVITGSGNSFSGGVDFRAAPAYGDAERRRMIGNINAAIAILYALPVPVVAAVNGHAIGGGLVVTLACDYRLFVTGDAKFGLTEIAAGIPYPAGPMQVVRAELAPPAARQLVLTGQIFTAERARSLGIADELVAAHELMGAAVARARALAAFPAFATVKQQLKRETSQRLRAIAELQDDPMLERWI